MKQGRADKSGRESWKREPIPKSVHETAVSELGRAVQFPKSPLYGGEGLKHGAPSSPTPGPGGGRTIHRSGSQGKHK